MAKLAGSRRAARRRTTCWTRGSMAEQFGVAASAQSAQRRIRRVDVETCRIEGPAAPLPHRGMLVVAGIRDRIQEVGVTTRRIDLGQAHGITAPSARKGQVTARSEKPSGISFQGQARTTRCCKRITVQPNFRFMPKRFRDQHACRCEHRQMGKSHHQRHRARPIPVRPAPEHLREHV